MCSLACYYWKQSVAIYVFIVTYAIGFYRRNCYADKMSRMDEVMDRQTWSLKLLCYEHTSAEMGVGKYGGMLASKVHNCNYLNLIWHDWGLFVFCFGLFLILYFSWLLFIIVMLSVLQSQFIEKGSKKTENFEQNVVLLLFLFPLDFIFPRGKFGSPHLIKHSSRKSSATHSYQCVQYVPVSRQWCGCQCLGFFLTCTQMSIRAIAHGYSVYGHRKTHAAPGTRTRVSIAPGFSVGRCTNWAIPTPQQLVPWAVFVSDGVPHNCWKSKVAKQTSCIAGTGEVPTTRGPIYRSMPPPW